MKTLWQKRNPEEARGRRIIGASYGGKILFMKYSTKSYGILREFDCYSICLGTYALVRFY